MRGVPIRKGIPRRDKSTDRMPALSDARMLGLTGAHPP